jgi:hypothetical protein
MAINYGGNDWSSDPQTALRMQLAKGLMQGQQAPAQGFGENVANLGSKLIGAYLMKQGLDEGRERESAKNDTMANALRAGQGQAAETKSYGDGTTIDWNERKADPNQMAAILAGNRDTAPIGMQLQFSQMDSKAKAEVEMAKALRERDGRRADTLYAHDLNLQRDAAKGYDLGGGRRFFPDGPGVGQSPQAAPAAPDLRTASTAPNPPPVERRALASALADSESSGRTGVVNKQGFSGKYQFGEAAATEAGFYEPDDNPNDNKWNGTFKGLPGVASYQDFLKNEGAQDQAFNMHQTHLNAEIDGRRLDKYIGQTVGGVTITRDGLTAMMHLGGPSGTEKFLKTGGQYNPADSGGTKLSDYGTKFAGGGEQPPAAPPRVQVADASGAIPASVPAPGPQRTTIGGRSGTVIGGEGEGGPFGGTGLPAQDSNLWIQFQTKLDNGEALTQQEQLAMALIQQRATQPRTIMTDQGLVQVPGMPLPTMPGRQSAAAAPPAPAVDTVPNPLQAPAAAQPPAAVPPPDQSAVRIIQPKADPKPTNEQSLQAGFANRLNSALATFNRLEEDGYGRPSLKDRAFDMVPGVSNYLTSDQFQQLEQAQRDFITAQLRRESGAAISESEFETAHKLYFPQPGEGPDVIAQKRASRELAVRNMAQSAGPAEIDFKLPPAPKAGDNPATPKPAAEKPAGNVPTFASPDDPGLAALPSGSVFLDPNGVRRIKP